MENNTNTPAPAMKDPFFVVNRGPADFVIIDQAIWDGEKYRGKYSGETLEQIRERMELLYVNGVTDYETRWKANANAELMEWEQASAMLDAAQRAKYVGPVKEITKDRFWYLLEVLPPVGWKRGEGSESFKMSERLTGSITTIAARIGEKYYEFNDNITMSHDAVIEKIQQAIKDGSLIPKEPG